MEYMKLSGAPFNLGAQHGQQLASIIPSAIEFYCHFPKASEKEVLAAAHRVEEVLLQRCAEVVEEMRGIAQGANVSYEDILLLNVSCDVKGEAIPRCTVIGLPRTADGPLVGKTDDVSLAERNLETFYRIEPDKGHACIYYAIAGTLWAVGGVNHAGLVQAVTGLLPGGAQNPEGIPKLIFLRLMLQRCGSIKEALALAEAMALLNCGNTMTLADPSSDEVVVVENYPTARGVQRSSDEPIVRTNHCLCPETIPLMANMQEHAFYGFPGLPENSQARYENATRLAQEIPRSVEGLKQFLGDHNPHGAVCQHGQADLHTSVAMILVPRRRAMIVAEGYGCGPYIEWTL